ncbi:MAG TPA: CPBP family glutamic-type intramembrane protease [Anaerolineales bacterium]|nr:CPBP family glutamic-type intramembrane protease [Anaerolineales bacterium]
MKWIAPALAYLAVGLGLFVFHNAWGALLGFHAAIIGSLLIARPNIPVSILFTATNKKWIALSFVLAGGSGIALYFLRDVFRISGDLPAQLESIGLTSSTWIPFIAYFAAVNPFVEEYFWRGYLGDAAKGLYGSDLIYAGFHAMILIGKVHPGSIVFGLAVLTFAGWFWRQMAREDGGLLAPVLGHMGADFTILMAVYWMIT